MVSEMRKNPSPLGPYAGPGETTTPASSSTSSANDSDVWPSGTHTQKYGVAFGHWAFLRILWETDGLTQRALSEEAGLMEPTTSSALADQLLAGELSDAAELAAIAEAWRRWAADPNAWFAVLHGEVVATRA